MTSEAATSAGAEANAPDPAAAHARAEARVAALVASWGGRLVQGEDARPSEGDVRVDWLVPSVALVWRTTGEVAWGESLSEAELPVEGLLVGPDSAAPLSSAETRFLFSEPYLSETCHYTEDIAEPPTMARLEGADVAVVVDTINGHQLIFDGHPALVSAQCSAEMSVVDTECGRTLVCGGRVLGLVGEASIEQSACTEALVALDEELLSAAGIARTRVLDFIESHPLPTPPPACPAPPRARRLFARDQIRRQFDGPEDFEAMWLRVNFSCPTADGEFGVRLIDGDDVVRALYWVRGQRVEPLVPREDVEAEVVYADLNADGVRDWLVRTRDASTSVCPDADPSPTWVVSQRGVAEMEGRLRPAALPEGTVVFFVEDHEDEGAWRFNGTHFEVAESPVQRLPAACATPILEVEARASEPELVRHLVSCGVDETRAHELAAAWSAAQERETSSR